MEDTALSLCLPTSGKGKIQIQKCIGKLGRNLIMNIETTTRWILSQYSTWYRPFKALSRSLFMQHQCLFMEKSVP